MSHEVKPVDCPRCGKAPEFVSLYGFHYCICPVCGNGVVAGCDSNRVTLWNKLNKPSKELNAPHILNCPFCGKGADVSGRDKDWRVVCRSCMARSGSEATPEKAVSVWNKRAEP